MTAESGVKDMELYVLTAEKVRFCRNTEHVKQLQ